MKSHATLGVIACALAAAILMPAGASAEDAATAAARARQQQINQQNAANAAAMQARQRQINQQNAARYRPPATSTTTAAGYNTSRSTQTTIGSNPNTGASTAGDRAAMDKIRSDAAKLR